MDGSPNDVGARADPSYVTPLEREFARLEAEIAELWGYLNAATYRFWMLVAEFDRKEGWGWHENGEPLSVGRKTRSIPPSLQRALKSRDGGCRFPGCDRTRYTEGHHVQHWADGGETKLSNLITLCGFSSSVDS